MSSSRAQEAAERAEELLLARARAQDMRQAKYFAAGMAGLLALFTIVNWSQFLFNKYGRSKSPSLDRSIQLLSRPVQRIIKGYQIGNVAIRPGRVFLAMAYFGIILTLMFTNIDLSQEIIFAKRCGWLTLCNLCLTIFLSLKNTPISPLAGRSYESINVLHRTVGYTTILLMILHSTNYIAALFQAHLQMYLMVQGQYAAATAAVSFLIIGVTASRFIRKRQYELFYIVHVTLVTVVLITVLIHVMQINWSAVAVIIVSACLWFADRSLRLSRWIYNGYGNYCTLTPLPEGATKVTMKRSIPAQAGSHAFLYIPQIRLFQTHPFTLVSNDPAQFVVSAQDGFTRRLYDLAMKSPEAKFRASVEGPYGNVPNVQDFDRVVLLSGGSGITFTLSLALDWLRKREQTTQNKVVDFIWTVKTIDYLDWFEAELKELQSWPSVNLKIHITSNITPKVDALSHVSTPSSEEESMFGNDLVKSEKWQFDKALQYGRPDVESVVKNATVGVSKDSRVLIAASGPSGLLNNTRLATRACTTTDSPSIQLHLEEFDW